MTNYKIVMSKQAKLDRDKVKNIASLKRNAQKLLDIMAENPYADNPSYEKLGGELQGLYSRRLNRKHRIVYEVREEEKVVVIYRMWTHYDL